jgi:hypothetical protein
VIVRKSLYRSALLDVLEFASLSVVTRI